MMQSVGSEKVCPMRRRTLSRGMSEDESLRHIIREAEEASRHLTRSDSRCGSLRRGQKDESLGEEDLLEMVELRANYEMCLQEVRALELKQAHLLFQVDCLQDALEGAEEMLSESQREARCVKTELEREREARRKLEDMVSSLTQEMKVLREEKNSIPITPVSELVGDQTQGLPNESQHADSSPVFSGTSVDGDISEEGMSTVVSQSPASTQEPVLTSSRAAPASFFKSGQTEQFPSKHAGPNWLKGAPEGTSVDQDETALSNTGASQGDLSGRPVLQLEKIKQTFCQSVDLNVKCEAHDGDENDESSGYEDAPSEFSPSPSTPDVQPDGGFSEGENDSSTPKPGDSCALS